MGKLNVEHLNNIFVTIKFKLFLLKKTEALFQCFDKNHAVDILSPKRKLCFMYIQKKVRATQVNETLFSYLIPLRNYLL